MQITPQTGDLTFVSSNNIQCNNSVYQTPPNEVKSNNSNVNHFSKIISSPNSIINCISLFLSKMTSSKNINDSKINNSVISIKSFLIEILRRSKCNKNVVILATYYFDKLLSENDYELFPVFAKCAKRIYLIYLIIAHKFLNDNTFSMKTWSNISGLNQKNLTDMERWCLNKLNYNLFIDNQKLAIWQLNLLKEVSSIVQEKELIQTSEKRHRESDSSKDDFDDTKIPNNDNNVDTSQENSLLNKRTKIC